MRVLIADEHFHVRSALRLLLAQEAGVATVAEATDAVQVLASVDAGPPDLVLLDWEMVGRAGGPLLARLRALCPGLRVIVLSGRPEACREALDAGADAFVSKGDPPERLLAAVGAR